jgi:Flp pilus assembly pilin Flp
MREEEGAGLIEYVLLVTLIALVCILAVTIFGTTIQGAFEMIQSNL